MLTSLQIFQFHIILVLFANFILPILAYGSEVSGISKADNTERTLLQFCKHLLGVKMQTQNNFVYGELGKVTLRNHRLVSVIQCDDAKILSLHKL